MGRRPQVARGLSALVVGAEGNEAAQARWFGRLWGTSPFFIAAAAADAGFAAYTDVEALTFQERPRILEKAHGERTW